MAHSRKLTRDIIVISLILCAVLLVPVVYLSHQAQQDISEQFIDNTASVAVAKFQAIKESMTTTLTLVHDWGANQVFSLNDLKALNQLLLPIFEQEELLFGMSVADIDGNSYHIRRQGVGWRSTWIEAMSAPRRAMVTSWDAQRKQQLVVTEASDFDPRSRPWFAPALAQEDIFWTEPYKFYDSKEVGTTASISFFSKKDNKQVVVAFDILLEDLFTEIQKLAPSDNSRVFIIRRDSQLYVPKTNEHPANFLNIYSVQETLLQQAYKILAEYGEVDNQVSTIKDNGTTWWVRFLPLDPKQNTTWLCVLVPGEDIVSRVGQRRMMLWLFGVSTILLVAGVSLWFVKKYGQQNESMGNKPFESNDPETSIRKLIDAGESTTVEFKATLRMNLHAKRPGKEIELAWLKAVAAFLNSDGGILLLGVTDAGEFTGLEQDVFENWDKCKLHFKNLIAEHLGSEFSKYIDFQIYPVAGHIVGVVRCDRSTEPVFLKANKVESFYIRNGPSSDELPVSKVLNYIKNRYK